MSPPSHKQCECVCCGKEEEGREAESVSLRTGPWAGCGVE